MNTVRGSGFPEISLDDLAIEFFDSSADRGRSGSSSNSDVRGRKDVGDTGSGCGGSVRRGRSVSRQATKGNGGDSSAGGRVISGSNNNTGNNNSRRRRSVSAVRYQISDSERPAAASHGPALRRSLSHKDLKYNDGYSSQSSALTDDEVRDSRCAKNGIERTIQAVYAQKKLEHPIGDDLNGALYDVMRKELRHAVEEIKMELEQGMTKTKTNDKCLQSKNIGALQTASTIRRSYAAKLEQSEKRKQELLAEILLEEQRGRELSKIVQELLPDPKVSVVEKPSCARKRSNDRSRVSKRLTEEAEKYFEDFISNVEDTDISSLDGERSDTSSTLGGITKTETFQSPTMSKPLPAEMDGVVLPWLQWETTNDASSQSCKTKTQPRATPKTKFLDGCQESTAQDLSYHSNSSRGSWSPVVLDVSSINFGEDKWSKYVEPESCQSQLMPNGTTRFRRDVDEYLKLQKDEDFLLERWRQKQRINSGGFLLCNQMFF